ncbi:MAG: FAD:protein FMN transferase [bacterium]
MKVTRDDLMNMPITVEIEDVLGADNFISEVFSYFEKVEEKFSTFKKDSEISRINAGLIAPVDYSEEVKEILKLAEQTRKETNGYFNIVNSSGKLAPLGLVKGWAIYNASKILINKGVKNFYINAGGDIQAIGKNKDGEYFRAGIRNPFKHNEIVKVVELKNVGMATSGIYIRGQHIYNPHKHDQVIDDVVSLTIIGPNVYEADRFATAAFAMGKDGIKFIEKLEGFEGYSIDKNGVATMTSNFEKYVIK